MARTPKGLIGPSTSLQLPWRFIFRAALGVALLLLLLLRLLVGQLVLVRGDLMAPLIHDGDVLVVRHARVPSVGDVVLLDLEDDAPPRLRRVLAQPGDRIATINGAFVRNGQAAPLTLVGPYAWSHPETSPGAQGPQQRKQLLYREEAPEGSRAVLGEHMGAARPWRLSLPELEVPPGLLFVLCDNRRDCPTEETAGLVPATAVVGIADAFVWYGDARSQTEALQPLYGGLIPVATPAPASNDALPTTASAPAATSMDSGASPNDAAAPAADAGAAPGAADVSP
jgi:signal peptidase I